MSIHIAREVDIVDLYTSTFNGMHIIESVYLVENGEPIVVHRTWRERLFSRPWTPLIKTRTVVPQIPYRGAVQLDANTLVMHPYTLAQLRKELKDG